MNVFAYFWKINIFIMKNSIIQRIRELNDLIVYYTKNIDIILHAYKTFSLIISFFLKWKYILNGKHKQVRFWKIIITSIFSFFSFPEWTLHFILWQASCSIFRKYVH